jgi:hypothetical protein
MQDRDLRSRQHAEQLVIAAFARIDAVAMGCAFGVLAGLAVSAATIILVLKGGDQVGPRLALLAQYFPGYTVTAGGSLIGLVYGSVAGFCAGWLLAALRNACNRVYLNVVHVRSQISSIHEGLD